MLSRSPGSIVRHHHSWFLPSIDVCTPFRARLVFTFRSVNRTFQAIVTRRPNTILSIFSYFLHSQKEAPSERKSFSTTSKSRVSSPPEGDCDGRRAGAGRNFSSGLLKKIIKNKFSKSNIGNFFRKWCTFVDSKTYTSDRKIRFQSKKNVKLFLDLTLKF